MAPTSSNNNRMYLTYNVILMYSSYTENQGHNNYPTDPPDTLRETLQVSCPEIHFRRCLDGRVTVEHHPVADAVVLRPGNCFQRSV